MMVGTLVVLKQLSFFRNTDLGFDKENVLIISSTNRLGESQESFRQSVIQTPGVLSASITTSIPSGGAFGDSYVPEPEGVEETVKEINLSSYMVDESFIPALDIKVLEGRNFSKEFSDSASVIINQEALKQIGWKNPLGKWLDYPGVKADWKLMGSSITMENPFNNNTTKATAIADEIMLYNNASERNCLTN